MNDRVWCSRGYQGADELRGTLDVILGPPCRKHLAPMHRAPAVPSINTTWVCHGYDGEGCEEIATSRTCLI